MTYLYILLGILGGVGLVTFIVYGIDKLKAKRHAWRISEATLLSLSIFGGCLGGIFAMLIFRHKTRHWYFWAINILACAIYIALLIVILIYCV
ncbi:MAG: DUF1294 domain-containing protein [Candidatus Coproplasma sp.]